jgi:hypothetical protein
MVIHFVKSLNCPDAMRNFCSQSTIVWLHFSLPVLEWCQLPEARPASFPRTGCSLVK